MTLVFGAFGYPGAPKKWQRGAPRCRISFLPGLHRAGKTQREDGKTVYKELYRQIGYVFRDESLLKLALCHPSAGPENNQRLEFLGDAVLQLCVSDRIYRTRTQVREGEMTSIRQKLVCEQALAAVARDIGLGPLLLMEHGFALSGGRLQDGPLSDAMEALLAAVYLDGGYSSAFGVVQRLWEHRTWKDTEKADSKSALQEWTQAHLGVIPEYAVEAEEGPPHDRTFTVSCHIPGGIETRAEGKSKKRAEQTAAAEAMAILKAARRSQRGPTPGDPEADPDRDPGKGQESR